LVFSFSWKSAVYGGQYRRRFRVLFGCGKRKQAFSVLNLVFFSWRLCLKLLLSFYIVAYERGRLKWYWLQSVDGYPTDWMDWMHLKQQLREAMIKAFIIYGRTEAAIALDKHTGGSQEPAGPGGTYAKRPIPHRRERIAFFRQVQINRQT